MAVWQKHAQYQDPQSEAAKVNSELIHFIIYTSASPAGMLEVN